MSGDNKNNSLIVQIISSVIIALLAGATAPWWWQEIKSFFARKPPEPSLTPIPTPTYTPQKTLINIAYLGDNFGCVLPIAINISGQYFYPQGNFSTINNIDLGQQRYQITGQIRCQTIGNCQVYGEGLINVIPNNTYYVIWQNTSIGQCTARLQ
ncbi:hypothetical protein MTo_02878 [Microcystis aeruginosa NIES-1211]|jgi:hypothetical protein|uniref:Uncharacterized protein n=1 Tax=Microcystis aeruginosa NIES-2519 TaxID=2303981 RepID=A0A5A5R8F6_MICAE|nr:MULTISPECIES: hypothetical protein [Microcystis]AVQ72482.1 hypothetical protein B5D77_15265 [Microcystis sp. MC19]CCI34282.1 Similarity [Microcystis sp. T1-4]GBL15564.1 hypothetical protein MTo_02878 [Microcystis aeruginosa NIES-1211]GCA71338.1 hypothetical protein MiYa_02877 [Microcystis aeruginosa NIES-2519]GCA84535.1 hypothetical protein MiHa_02508 [Microcystis aeruginosa NIES-2522]